MILWYSEASPVIFSFPCNDPEQGRLPRSVVSYESDPALWCYEPIYSVQDRIVLEIYLQFLYFYQLLLPPGL